MKIENRNSPGSIKDRRVDDFSFQRTTLTFDKSYLCANVRMQLILREHQRKAKLTFEKKTFVIVIVRNIS